MLVKKLHKKQYEVALDKTRFKVICAGRRGGKSVLARFIVLQWATERVGTYWIVSPTYKQSKQIHWRELTSEVPKSWVSKKNEVELSLTLKNGSIIELKGAENPDALRGVKLRGLVIDEIASIRNWNWLWQEVLRPTLTDYSAPALFISTPKGFNHFYDLYSTTSADYKSWKFTSYDNPYIPKEEIDHAKAELTENTFYQEYMADFRKYTGLVYKDFDKAIHVVSRFNIPDNWPVYAGFDFGSTNPTAIVWVAVDGDSNLYLVDEHYQTGGTIDQHAGIFNAHPLRSRITQSFADPSGAQWIHEFNNRSVYLTPADKRTGTDGRNWVRFGIEKVAERLKPVPGHVVYGLPDSYVRNERGMPKLFVFDHCVNTIREFEQYRWKEKKEAQDQSLNEPDQPEKANDHLMDALRYVVVSYTGHTIERVENDFAPYKNIW